MQTPLTNIHILLLQLIVKTTINRIVKIILRMKIFKLMGVEKFTVAGLTSRN